MKRRPVFLLLLLVLATTVIGCTAGPNPAAGLPAACGHSASFWLGMWHGFISPVTFVMSLLMDNVTMYEVHNSGGWYDFGFVLGAGILFGGSGKSV